MYVVGVVGVVVVVGLNSPNCKMSIPLGVSQVVSFYKEWWKCRGRGYMV